jgi:hypothetical protein
VKRKKSKEERRRDREIVELNHKKLTEDELQPLYEKFTEWHSGNLPYFELTEHIHQFHKIKKFGNYLITVVGIVNSYFISQRKSLICLRMKKNKNMKACLKNSWRRIQWLN